jgi:molecular chaperone DnaK
VLEIGKDIFEVLATCGDTFLGGDDFDDRLIDLLADEFVASEGVNPRNDPFAYEKLKLAAENAKKQLSVDEEVLVSIDDLMLGEDGQQRSLTRTITRAELATLIHDLVLRTFKVCDEALQQADLTVRDLDGVILVGGPTRLPIVREAVAGYFQQEPRTDVDPDEVVAMGAAIHAASLVGEAQDSMLLDVTPLDLRIGVAGGLAEPVIERNTPVPIEQTRTFTTFQDHQESVQIRVYQGDHRQAEDNALLGQFEFSGFQNGLRADVKIDVTFEIDADGIVNVTASDQATGEAASTQITLSSGLDDNEIERIIDEDRTGRVATAGFSTEQVGDEVAPLASPAAAAPPSFPEPEASSETANTDVTVVEDPGPDLDLDSGADDEELLIELTQPGSLGAEDVTLDVQTPSAESDDDGFFDSAGLDLSEGDADFDLELADEEK